MLSFPNAKLNLGLYITNKRADGYHDLETVFYPLPLTDALEIIPAKEAAMHISGMAIEGDGKDNLVWKAYTRLQQNFPDKVKPMDIFLHKVIPMGAGMGGGSADGAFMLKALNTYYELGLTNDQLALYALELGSDCPFFIYNTPHFAAGRGELLDPIQVDLSGFSLQVICPAVHVSTAEAFKMIVPKPAPFDLHSLGALPVVAWEHKVGNDFEAPVFSRYPELADIKQHLYNGGAVYASMSGSGSTIYGIMPKRRRAKVNADIAFKSYYFE